MNLLFTVQLWFIGQRALHWPDSHRSCMGTEHIVSKIQGGRLATNISRNKETHTLSGTWKPSSEVLQPSGSGIWYPGRGWGALPEKQKWYTIIYHIFNKGLTYSCYWPLLEYILYNNSIESFTNVEKNQKQIHKSGSTYNAPKTLFFMNIFLDLFGFTLFLKLQYSTLVT